MIIVSLGCIIFVTVVYYLAILVQRREIRNLRAEIEKCETERDAAL